MFEQFYTIINEGSTKETAIEEKYNQKRINLSIEIRKKIEEELKKVSSDDLLKNYNPIEYSNQMLLLSQTFKDLENDEQKEMEEIKKEIYSKINSLMHPVRYAIRKYRKKKSLVKGNNSTMNHIENSYENNEPENEVEYKNSDNEEPDDEEPDNEESDN